MAISPESIAAAQRALSEYNKAHPENLEAVRKQNEAAAAQRTTMASMPDSMKQAEAIRRRLEPGTDLAGNDQLYGSGGFGASEPKSTAYTVGSEPTGYGSMGFMSKTPTKSSWKGFEGADGADLSKPRYEDPTKAKSGEEIYLTQTYTGQSIPQFGSKTIPPGNYTIEVKDEGMEVGSSPGTITGETRTRTYAIDSAGKRYLLKEDNKKASESFDWWNNPLNPLSWFN